MTAFASRMEGIGTDGAFQVGIEVADLERKGRKVTKMHIGQPDFHTPENVKEAAVAAITQNKTGYTTANGIFELRQTVAGHLKQAYGAEVNPDCVVITPGTKPVLFMSAFALLNPGDEVIVPNPSYPIYEASTKLMGAKPVFLPILEGKGFSFDHEALKNSLNSKTKLMFLNTPANPTGGVLSRDDMKLVRDMVLEHPNLTLVCDEIYSRITYGVKHESIMQFPEIASQTILADGWGKVYSMTGWRMGFGVMPLEIAKKMSTVAINIYSGVVNFNQYAVMEAFKGPQGYVDNMISEFDERRKLIVKLLNEVEDVSCVTPLGAFYAFPNIKKVCAKSGMDSKKIAHWLLYEHGLAILPGTAFGSGGEGYLRFSYAASQDAIREGVEKMKKAFATL